MPYVTVPRDLTKVKTKVALGLTKRQLVCFGAATIIGVPTYFFTRGTIGNSPAVLLMIGVMLPAFFMAMYERDGQPAEKILRNIIRARFLLPQIRPYRTENFYRIIQREVQLDKQSQRARKAPVGKRPAGKSKQKRPAKHKKSKTARAKQTEMLLAGAGVWHRKCTSNCPAVNPIPHHVQRRNLPCDGHALQQDC